MDNLLVKAPAADPRRWGATLGLRDPREVTPTIEEVGTPGYPLLHPINSAL